jgi:hypothetical protein
MARRYTAQAILEHCIKLAEEYEANRKDFPSADSRYSYWMKQVRIGKHPGLTDRGIWYRLPDSVEALYQLSRISDDDEFERLMDLKHPDGLRMVICKSTEAATVRALCRSGKLPPSGPEVRLYYELGNDGILPITKCERVIQEAHLAKLHYGDEPDMYGFIFMQGAFYLVRRDENEYSTLYLLRDHQAETVLMRLAKVNAELPFTWINKSAVVPKADKEAANEGWDNLAFPITHLRNIDTEQKYQDVPLVNGQHFKKLVVPIVQAHFMGGLSHYEPSPRRVIEGGDFYDVTGRPLPDKIVRYVYWRRYIPKEIEKYTATSVTDHIENEKAIGPTKPMQLR